MRLHQSPRAVAVFLAGALLCGSGAAHAFGSGDDRGSAGFKGLLLISGARIAALGGACVALPENPTSFAVNPASLGTLTKRHVSLSATDYVLDILPVGGMVAYPSAYGVWSVAVNNLSYGEFDRVDEFAGDQGTFSANDIVFHVGWARTWRYGISGGLSLGWVRSSIAEYSASAFVANFGLLWETNDRQTAVGLSATNLGGAFSSYLGGDQGMKDDVPSAFHVGLMHRPAHFPVPLSLLADVTLPRDDEATLSLAAEAQPVGPLYVRVGYNSLVRYVSSVGPDNTRDRRLALDDRRTGGFGGLGLAMGMGIVWRQFGLDYAYGLAGPFGSVHHLTAHLLW